MASHLMVDYIPVGSFEEGIYNDDFVNLYNSVFPTLLAKEAIEVMLATIVLITWLKILAGPAMAPPAERRRILQYL